MRYSEVHSIHPLLHKEFQKLNNSTSDMLINQTSQLFLEFEGDLSQNLNVDNLRVRKRTIRTMDTMFEHVGRYFLELGCVMRHVQSRMIGIQHDLYLAGLQQRQHQHEQASANIRQNNELKEVHGEENNRNTLSPSRDDFIHDSDIHVEETATSGATNENVTENMGTSTVEYRSAHEWSIELSYLFYTLNLKCGRPATRKDLEHDSV